MSLGKIIWTDGGVISKLIAGALARLHSLFPRVRRRAPSQQDLQVFLTEFSLARVKGRNARKAAELALDNLIPLPAEQLIIFGRKSPQRPVLDIAVVKKSDLISNRSKDPWITLSGDWRVLTPRAQKVSQDRSLIALLGIIASLASIAYLYVGLYSSMAVRFDDTVAVERTHRQAALARADFTKDTQIWDMLVGEGVTQTMPALVHVRLSQLNQSTPQSAYWTNVVISRSTAELSGKARDPFAVLDALSNAPSIASAQFVGGVEGDNGVGGREFTIAVQFEGQND